MFLFSGCWINVEGFIVEKVIVFFNILEVVSKEMVKMIFWRNY